MNGRCLYRYSLMMYVIIPILLQDKSSSRQKDDSGPEPPKSDNIKDWTQQELDSFISKNDWGSVAKYINEMRQNKGNNTDEQADTGKVSSAREIQEQIDYNQKLQQQGGKSTPPKPPRRSSSAQDDDTSHSEYTPSATQASESVWDSVSSDSYSEESSQYYKSKRGSASKRRAKEVMM